MSNDEYDLDETSKIGQELATSLKCHLIDVLCSVSIPFLSSPYRIQSSLVMGLLFAFYNSTFTTLTDEIRIDSNKTFSFFS